MSMSHEPPQAHVEQIMMDNVHRVLRRAYIANISPAPSKAEVKEWAKQDERRALEVLENGINQHDYPPSLVTPEALRTALNQYLQAD